MVFRSLLAVILVSVVLPSVSEAQHRRPIQNFNRAMGIWHGHGRHICTPGHDSSYYNPWSAHNSGLVTRGYPVQSQMHFQYYTPQQNVDPFYKPKPKVLPATPLGGSYEPFGDDDVQEKVPTIDPVEGKPATKREADPADELGSQDFIPLLDPETELPRDALIFPASSPHRTPPTSSANWQGK